LTRDPKHARVHIALPGILAKEPPPSQLAFVAIYCEENWGDIVDVMGCLFLLQGLEGWKVKCQEELNEYRKQVAADHVANLELEIERWQSRRANNVSNTHAEADIGTDEGGDSFKEHNTVRGDPKGDENIEEYVEQAIVMDDDDDETANMVGEGGEVLLDREGPERAESLEVKGGRNVESTLNGIHGYGSGAEIKEDNLAI
jgi:uncharacterized protein YdaU (DUF1376 family)